MKRVISYICISLFSLFICSLDVFAYSYSGLDYVENLGIDSIKEYNDFLNDLSSSYKFNVCYISYNDIIDVIFNCYYTDNFNFIDNENSVIGLFDDVNYYSIYYYSIDKFDVYDYVSGNSSYTEVTFLFNSYRSWIFWTADSFFVSSGSFSIDDDSYSNISSFYKNYYNFQNLIEAGKPLYSLSNLVQGDWAGYESSVDIVYCYDGLCDSFVSETLYYNYGIENSSINLIDYLDSDINGYQLDTSYSYVISANNTNQLKVYYYGDSYNYSVNFYLDDVYSDEYSYTSSAYIGSTITLDNLEEVIDDIYFLQDDDYSIVLSSNNSVINVYYYSIDVQYDVYVYLDDIYYQAYSYSAIGKVGESILIEGLDELIDIYYLSDSEYSITLVEDSSLNVVNVYYYSDNYSSKYQDIDTSNKFYIAFDWIYIKDLFNLNGLYTQTEQFVIVYVVNILFYVICFLFIYVGLKMLYKLFGFVTMFLK